ncbi:MAG: putative hydrolase of the alpha/beta-hydrolase fold protein [Labilithrix sp.]|nr:putative hydrolase of the alpha/beta-hydrolase fold protein [Labilithrix sp.]
MKRFEFDVAAHGRTTATIHRAKDPLGVTLVLAHGAGTGQAHPFMVGMAARLAARGMDVITFDFLYMARGKKLPDRSDVLEATWHAAVASVRARVGLRSERLFIGGKSMGGRIASNLAATPAGEGLSLGGLVFLGYPLHPPGKPLARRDEHLAQIPFPLLFVQGSRDPFGDGPELTKLVRRLPRASLHLVDGGDHSLALPKSAGAEAQDEALGAAADAIAAFVKAPAPKARPKRRRQP